MMPVPQKQTQRATCFQLTVIVRWKKKSKNNEFAKPIVYRWNTSNCNRDRHMFVFNVHGCLKLGSGKLPRISPLVGWCHLCLSTSCPFPFVYVLCARWTADCCVRVWFSSNEYFGQSHVIHQSGCAKRNRQRSMKRSGTLRENFRQRSMKHSCRCNSKFHNVAWHMPAYEHFYNVVWRVRVCVCVCLCVCAGNGLTNDDRPLVTSLSHLILPYRSQHDWKTTCVSVTQRCALQKKKFRSKPAFQVYYAKPSNIDFARLAYAKIFTIAMGLQLFGCVDFSANYGNIVNKDNKVPRHVSPEPPVWAWLKNDDHSMHLGIFSFEKKKITGAKTSKFLHGRHLPVVQGVVVQSRHPDTMFKTTLFWNKVVSSQRMRCVTERKNPCLQKFGMRQGCLWRRKVGRAGIVVLRAWTSSRISALSLPASYFLCRNVKWRRATLRKFSKKIWGLAVTYCFAVRKWGLVSVINKINVCKKRMRFLTCRWAAAWADFFAQHFLLVPHQQGKTFQHGGDTQKKRLDQNTTKRRMPSSEE